MTTIELEFFESTNINAQFTFSEVHCSLMCTITSEHPASYALPFRKVPSVPYLYLSIQFFTVLYRISFILLLDCAPFANKLRQQIILLRRS
jgi:hypothetical protein